jgi:hypothetical protein
MIIGWGGAIIDKLSRPINNKPESDKYVLVRNDDVIVKLLDSPSATTGSSGSWLTVCSAWGLTGSFLLR